MLLRLGVGPYTDERSSLEGLACWVSGTEAIPPLETRVLTGPVPRELVTAS